MPAAPSRRRSDPRYSCIRTLPVRYPGALRSTKAGPTSGLVLADDATGALECASLLAGMGCEVRLSKPAQFSSTQEARVTVIDTESRHLEPSAAAASIRRALGTVPETALFKKTDSTLRGNIAAELLAVLDEFPPGPLIYVPAYPAFGRIVRDGQLYVRGLPVAETEFAGDVREPVRNSRIACLFPAERQSCLHSAAGPAVLRDALKNGIPGIHICDAEDDEGIGRLFSVIRESGATPTIAGPAGLIREWSRLCGFPRSETRTLPSPEQWLIVCGSLHSQSRRQTARARELGLAVLQAPEERIDSPAVVAAGLAREALAAIDRQRPDALLILGGDTVMALWQAMDFPKIEPLPEVLPGIAAHRLPEKGLLVVTKAGGFGDDRLVEQILERFK